MITAALLGTTLAFEPGEPDAMRRPPRRRDAPLLSPVLIQRIVLVGALILAGAFGLYQWELAAGVSLAEARTAAVNVVVMVELFYLFNSRSLTRSPFQVGFFSNRWALAGSALMVLAQLLFTYLPGMNYPLDSAPIGPATWTRVLAVALAGYLIIELEKWLRLRMLGPAGRMVYSR
jgi:cation-transporting P-type ATPase F